MEDHSPPKFLPSSPSLVFATMYFIPIDVDDDFFSQRLSLIKKQPKRLFDGTWEYADLDKAYNALQNMYIHLPQANKLKRIYTYDNHPAKRTLYDAVCTVKLEILATARTEKLLHESEWDCHFLSKKCAIAAVKRPVLEKLAYLASVIMTIHEDSVNDSETALKLWYNRDVNGVELFYREQNEMHVKLTLGIVDLKNAYRCHLTRTAEHDREFDCRHQEHLSEPKK